MALLSAKVRYVQDGLTVPFITAWEPERISVPQLIVRRNGHGPYLAYADEGPLDRDGNGVLWVRQGLARGRGKALFPQVHAFRQRRAMFDLWCQVCGGLTLEESDERQLYVLNSAKGVPIREGECTTAPPVCFSCAPEAAMSCPKLRDDYVAAYATWNHPWGIAGILYDPRTLRVVGRGLTEIPFGDPRMRYLVAHRSVSVLSGITAVDLAGFTTAV
ncbi:hypothetical protein [Streptomyces narbonensis]|uniref:hypothetical protein n=1 Tax=Streptomyces narbonensis TaxID=67333 RepID=UPI0033C6E1D7